MGFWNKLGKIALTAAPYVAAPFTGGASLAFTGAANKAVQKWSESDAKKAAEKGLGPSSFDKYLGMAGNIGSMATGLGAFNKLGNLSGKATQMTPFQNKLQTAGNIASGNRQQNPYDYMPTGINGQGGWQGALGGIVGDYLNRPSGSNEYGGGNLSNNRDLPSGVLNYSDGGGAVSRNQPPMRGLGPVMGARDQNNPNLALSIGAGRQDAIRNQPFRRGYDVTYLGSDDETPITASLPPIRTGTDDRRRNRR